MAFTGPAKAAELRIRVVEIKRQAEAEGRRLCGQHLLRARLERITTAEARRLLANDVAEVQTQVAKEPPSTAKLTDSRRMVLEAMAFQMGIAGSTAR